MKNILQFLLTLFILNSAQGQSEPFYLKFLNDEKYEFQNSTIPFVTQVDEKLIYLRNYNVMDKNGQGSLITRYDNYLILSDFSGETIKEIHLVEDQMTYSKLNTVRHLDKILVFGAIKSDISNYLRTYTFDLDLNLISDTKTYYEEQLSWQIYFPKYFDFENKMYIFLCDAILEKGGIVMRFNEKGEVEMEKSSSSLDGLDIAGIALSPGKDQILVYNLGAQSTKIKRYDLDYTFIDSKLIYPVDIDTSFNFHWYSKFLPKDDGYVGFGRAVRHSNNSSLICKFTSTLDSNFVPKGKQFVDFTQETGYTDGPPRFTGGLFEGSDGFYTLYEIMTGHKTRYSSTFIINKYNFQMDQIWEKRFILVDSIKFWNYYAELTPEDRFIISGEVTDFTNTSAQENHFFGHIIGLDPNGNPSTSRIKKLLSNTMFSIIENPVRNELKMEKLTNDGKKYNIQILDLNGRVKNTSLHWADYNLNINVTEYPAGPYFYTISDNSGLIYSGNFLKI